MLVLRSIAILIASAAVAEAQLALDAQGDAPELLSMGAAKLEAVYTRDNETDRGISLIDAESLYQRAANLDAKNVAAFYWLGMIGWLRWHSARQVQQRPFPDAYGALVKASDVAVQRQSIANFERVVELQPGNHNAMAYLYLSLRTMARFEGSSEARLRDEAEADDWRERALSAASANHTNSLVPYPPPSSAPRTIPAPLLYLQTNGEVELIVLERIDKDSVCLRLVRGPKGPRRYEPLRGMIVGTVRFNVLILKDGTIRNLQVVSGHPILVQFTLGIAKDWVRDYWPRARFAPGAIEIAFTMEI